jgi:hypothetical protein
MWTISTDNREHYACGRFKERVLGNAAASVVLLPLLSRGLHQPLQRALIKANLPGFLASQYLPANPIVAAIIGASAGLLEDHHARIAWHETIQTERAEEPKLWTVRTLLPCVAFVIHPFIAMKALDGEMKGADCALAEVERRSIQQWPFFAVLEPCRPSPESSESRLLPNSYTAATANSPKMHML